MDPSRPHRPAIILVEDESDMLIILGRLLRNLTAHYDILPVSNGSAALAQIAMRPVSLVITDYNMPGMNGIELAARIKATAPAITVILISAEATPELAQRAHATGVDYYLAKPFPLDHLEAIVRSVLSAL